MTYLEPDFGSSGSTRRVQPDFTPTVRFPDNPAAVVRRAVPVSPLAPSLPDGFPSTATATRAPASAAAGLDTSAVIANLPDARKSFVTKYTRLGPSVQKLPQPVRAQLLKLDVQRVEQGQFPLSDKETLGAIVTAMTNQQATPEPSKKKESLWEAVTSLPGDAKDDAFTILKSIPHMPQALAKEAVALGRATIPGVGQSDARDIYYRARAAGANPIQAITQLPGVRLLPGAFVAGQVSRGSEGVRELANHPVMTTLDVLPYAGKAAKATKLGQVALEEGANPLRSVLTRKLLPEGEMTVTGSRLAPAKAGLVIEAIANTGPGQLASRTFGAAARKQSTMMAVGDQQLTDILQGDRPIDNPLHQAARDAYELASDGRSKAFPSLTEDRVIEVTRALEQDRNLLADPTKFTAEEQAFASRVIDLTDTYAQHLTASQQLMDIGGEIYDPKTGRRILQAQEKMGTRAAKVDEGLFTQVAKVRQDILDRASTVTGKAATLDRMALKRIDPVYTALDDYFNNPNTELTLADLEKASRGLARTKTRLGGSSQVGPLAAGPADIRLDTLARLRREIVQAAAAEKTFNARATRAPDRWIPAIQAKARETGEQLLIQRGVDPVEASRVILEQDFRAYPDLFNRDVMTELIRDTEPIWQDLKAAGVDPVFVHRVAPGRERALSIPRTSDFIADLSQTKKRKLYEMAPYNQDVTVGLAAQGVEIVSKDISTRVLGDIADTFGVQEASLRDHFMPQARRLRPEDPVLEATKLMNEGWTRFEPESFTGGGVARNVSSTAETVWLPKNIAKNLEAYYHPKPNAFLTAMSPVTGLFRTSVLALSPRWHFNNILGNAMVLGLEHGPGVFTKWGEARSLIKAFKAGEDVIPEELGYSFNVARKELAQSKYESARSWAGRAGQLAKGERAAKAWEAIQTAKAAGGKVVQKSYDLNSFFDDTSRAMSYLQSKKGAVKSLAKDGITGDAAELASRDAALQTVNRVFQNWNALTPIERDVLRQVFPFYSFTSYAMRFITSYPATHPVRAAIMSNLARSIRDDLGADIPPTVLDYLAVGGPDPNGDQRAVSLRGINPFGDTADLFTLQGFLAGLNPVGQAAAKTTGAELGGFTSPTTKTYDPNTGRMVNSRPGFLESLVGSTVPQAQLVARLTGRDTDFRALLRRDPAAAKRLIASGVGVPTVGRDINLTAEAMKAEIKRQATQQQVFRDAIQSGDYTDAMKWPALVPLLQQIAQLRDQNALTAYNPTAGPASNAALLPTAIRSVVP